MKKAFIFLLGLAVYAATIAVVVTAAAFWWLAGEFRAPGPLKEPALFEVARGESLITIAANLSSAGAIEQPLVFIIGTRIMNAQSALKAGEYELPAGASPREIMDKIKAGDVVARRVTFREGLTSYEVVNILKGVPELEGEISAIPPEGSLLPQTYDYRMGEQRSAIIDRMQADMRKTIDELWPTRQADLPLASPQEALILASIIEKETGVEHERRRVAGVFINRLRRGMPLQTDPTVIYGITMGRHENEGQGPLGRRLLRKDLEADTPYNTYTRPGLTPTPIANPGRASIEAALNPEAHDYIYFVADGSGGHVFARTLAEHNANAAKWRELRQKKD
jgi:UPF0755 protein